MHKELAAALAAGFIAALSAQPQVIPEALRSSKFKMSGLVLDNQRHPIEDVRVWHLAGNAAVRTDKAGHFEFETRVPAVVFRKPGFSSVFVQTANRSDLRVTMEPSERKLMRTCGKLESCGSILGFGAEFCLPLPSGLIATKQGVDVDYAARAYMIGSEHSKIGIRHGAGPMWSFGVPNDQDVWESSVYSEKTFDIPGGRVFDARGRKSDGKFWRFIGKMGESLDYGGLERSDAGKLDDVLDKLCIRQK